jgi:hypothetical protein
MNKTGVMILGILSILMLIVAVSGCILYKKNITSTQKVLAEYNLTSTYTNPITDTYVTLPNGVKSITIEYNNLTAVYNPISHTYKGDIKFFSFSIVAIPSESSKDYADKTLDLKTISVNSTLLSGSMNLKANGAKSVGIRNNLGKGNIKVLIKT